MRGDERVSWDLCDFVELITVLTGMVISRIS